VHRDHSHESNVGFTLKRTMVRFSPPIPPLCLGLASACLLTASGGDTKDLVFHFDFKDAAGKKVLTDETGRWAGSSVSPNLRISRW
jgi:hypothetical protein